MTHVLMLEDEVVVLGNVPARVNTETGERLFSPETVERIQQLLWKRPAPSVKSRRRSLSWPEICHPALPPNTPRPTNPTTISLLAVARVRNHPLVSRSERWLFPKVAVRTHKVRVFPSVDGHLDGDKDFWSELGVALDESFEVVRELKDHIWITSKLYKLRDVQVILWRCVAGFSGFGMPRLKEHLYLFVNEHHAPRKEVAVLMPRGPARSNPMPEGHQQLPSKVNPEQYHHWANGQAHYCRLGTSESLVVPAADSGLEASRRQPPGEARIKEEQRKCKCKDREDTDSEDEEVTRMEEQSGKQTQQASSPPE